MAHSVELLLDETSDQQIRRLWQVLENAGLPSQARVVSPTNRPHITLIAAHRIDPSIDSTLTPVGMRLPCPVAIGAPIVFGHGATRVLARLIVSSSELLSIHAQVVRLGGACAVGPDDQPEFFSHGRPGHWTPHVTLARRIPVDRVGDALAVLDDTPILGQLTALRRWDSDARTDHILAGRDC